ncbi:MAG: 5'-methylthioadenosine/S-adenosylhomocysteine nucleosidase [Clostridia bacterium]|nr:5'-methylthioadenosine/S-adenosylhomocysteine nucleosidase [Clostridia bacterium]
MKCFVIALESEARPIISHMSAAAEKEVYGKKIWSGKICKEKTCVIVCGVGKVNAACAAQYAIDILKADCVINVGMAGALNNFCNVADIYEIDRAAQYDFDLVQLNHTPIGTLNEFEDRWLKLETAGIFPRKSLATGDRFNDSAADFTLLTDDMQADIRDMEGAAIAQVCIHAGVPFYSFKAISDIAGSGSTIDQFLANTEACVKALDRAAEKIFNGARA